MLKRQQTYCAVREKEPQMMLKSSEKALLFLVSSTFRLIQCGAPFNSHPFMTQCDMFTNIAHEFCQVYRCFNNTTIIASYNTPAYKLRNEHLLHLTSLIKIAASSLDTKTLVLEFNLTGKYWSFDCTCFRGFNWSNIENI